MIRTRSAVALCLAVMLAAAPIATRAAQAGPAPAASAPEPMRIVYLAGASVYVNAGSGETLREGDTLSVRRGGAELARLRVSVLTLHRASCDTLFTRDELRTGDPVVRIGGAPPAAALAGGDSLVAPVVPVAAAAATPASTVKRPARARPWMRGRAGVRWLSVRADGGVHFDSPTADLRLEGGNDTTATALAIDVRGHRTVRTAAAGSIQTDAGARVYRAAMSLRGDGGRSSVAVGRLSSPSLGSVSIFDGALVSSTAGRWSLGAFGGTQPEPTRMGWSNDITEFGAYLESRDRGSSERRWRTGFGAVSSYDQGRSNRDFLFGQAFWRDRRVSGSLLQEADMVRNWKRQPGEPGFSFTSTFITANAQLHPLLSVQSGFDNRHNVRLYRDRVTPETEFDDRYRQGVWVGMNLRFPWGVGVAGDQRWNRGANDDASMTSADLDLFRPSWRGMALRGRWSEYRSHESQSRLLSTTLGANPLGNLHLDLSGGQRETVMFPGGARESIRWWGANGDLSLGRLWFLDASFESSKGDLEHTTQIYGGLSRRL